MFFKDNALIMNWQERTELMISKEGVELLAGKHVLVAGLGGVGGAVVEMLARAGVGHLTIIDCDVVHASNRNRQLLALQSTEGVKKTEVWASRLRDINPDIILTVIDEYIKDQRMIDILDEGFDFVVDAIDTLSPKVFLLYHCFTKNIPVISSMGAGGKLNPMLVKIDDIKNSNTCKLALYIRKRLHKLGVYEGIRVVYSDEKVSKQCIRLTEGEDNKLSTVGTISYMPNVFGCFCASVVINDFLKTLEGC